MRHQLRPPARGTCVTPAHHERRQRRGDPRVHGHVAPQARCRPRGFANTLSREVPFWGGPGKTFSEATTQLGLIRTARWFVGTSTEFGPTLYFVSQFDSSLEKYFDDFVLNGKENLEKIWGTLHRLSDWSERDGARHRAVRRARADQDPGLLRRLSEPQQQARSRRGRLVPEDAEIPARDRQGRRQARGQGQRLLRASWPSPTNSCRAAPTSTPTSPTSRSSPTCPSGWA